MKFKLNKENLLYIFILINPIFDLLSTLFRQLDFTYTPSTFLRPILPAALIIYIFVTDKNIRLKLAGITAIYMSYIIGHLYLYSGITTGFSNGSLAHELQYVINYTYLVFTLGLFIYAFYKKKHVLEDILLKTTTFIIGTVYLAIITNTSLSSYIEGGILYKGWYNTSGAISTLLLLSMFVLLPYLLKHKINPMYKYGFVFFVLFYLCFLVGSRVGLYGSILLIVIFGISYLIFNNLKNIKKHLPIIMASTLLVILTFVVFGSSTLERRRELNNLKDDEIHIAIDFNKIKIKIDNNTLEDGYMSNDQITALKKMASYAERHSIANVDLRQQQLVYNYYLWIEQNDLSLKLFGNGYLANYIQLTLEMETFALLFNFGVFGFALFFMPFLTIAIYSIYVGIKNIKKLDIEYIMYLSGVLISYMISLYAGHVYFNTSVMPIIIILHLLLLNKVHNMKKEV